MKILVTGSKGFVGKNLAARFYYDPDIELYEYDLDTDPKLLDKYCKNCDFIYNLAGVNRPKNTEEFMEGNFGFVETLLETLKKYDNYCPIMLASSIQAEIDNDYGKSKKAGEDFLLSYGAETGAPIFIYRFPNLFGKWCRPNYNSVVATFCHNIAHDLPIQINDEAAKITLVYIDDVVDSLTGLLYDQMPQQENGYCKVPMEYSISLKELANLLYSFKESRNTKEIPDMSELGFTKKLYSTYLSYLPKDQFSYPLKMNKDWRGSFTEILRTPDRGQFSVNISKPGIEKGNHWHNTKNEKFVVVSGHALIQFRKPDSSEIISYHVSGDKLEVVDIPVGYTHNIINEGTSDLVTFMWCNECFNPKHPDTYACKVNEDKGTP